MQKLNVFKYAPKDATHYVCVNGKYKYLKEHRHPNGDVFVIENHGDRWLPDSYINCTINEYIKRNLENNLKNLTRIIAQRPLEEDTFETKEKTANGTDLKQLEELLHSTINDWFNKL